MKYDKKGRVVKKVRVKSEGTPLAFSEELWYIFIKVYLTHITHVIKTTLLSTHFLHTLKSIFDFAWGRALPGTHKSKITHMEEDKEEKPTE